MKKFVSILIFLSYMSPFFIPMYASAFSTNDLNNNINLHEVSDLQLSLGGSVITNCNTWWRTTTCTSNYLEDPQPEISPAAVIVGAVVVLLLIGMAADSSSFVGEEDNKLFTSYNPFMGADIYQNDSFKVNLLKVNASKILSQNKNYYANDSDIEIIKFSLGF